MEEDKNFHGVSPILVEKTIQSYCGSGTSAKKTKDGKILVTVRNEHQAKNLAKIEKLCDEITVKVYEHKTLNSSKVVIVCRDLKEVSDDELLENLSSQRVTEVKQLMKMRDNVKTPMGVFVLTLKGKTPPKEVKIGYTVLETRPWYPNPMRCFKCLKFGHIGRNCSSEKKCGKCGNNYHEECENREKCINCGNEHGAFFNGCPVLKREKEIIKIKVDKNLSFWEARKMIEDQSSNTYADQVKQLNEEKKTLEEKIRADIKNQFEVKLKEYKEEIKKVTNENEKKMESMEEKYKALNHKFEHLVSVYKEEKTRRKAAENELESLKKDNSKLQATLNLYAPSHSGQKNPTKHTRSQEKQPSSPPRKKGNKMKAVTEEVGYISTDPENNSDDGNEKMKS